MCFGGGPKMPAPPPAVLPPPAIKSAAPPEELGKEEKIKENDTDELVSNKRKQALEIEKVKQGTKTFGAIDTAGNLAAGPPSGISGP